MLSPYAVKGLRYLSDKRNKRALDRLRALRMTTSTIEGKFQKEKDFWFGEIQMSQSIQDSQQLLTTRQAAEMLARSPATLKRWRSAGRGPEFIAIQGRISYRRETVAQFLEQHTKKPTAQRVSLPK